MRGRIPPRPRGRVLLFTLLLVLAGPWLPAASAAPVHEFEVVLAPIHLDGAYPVAVTTDGTTVAGVADLATDARGRLSGLLTLDGVEYEASGKVKTRAGGTKLTIVGKRGRDRITLTGTVDGSTATGTSKAPEGKGVFSLDLTGAGPLVARMTVEISILAAGKPGPNPKGKLAGYGTAIVGGTSLELKVTGQDAGKFRLKLAGTGFGFRATGTGLPNGVAVAWSATGFGSKAAGDGLVLPMTTAPKGLAYPAQEMAFELREDADFGPMVEGGAVAAWSIEPALPAGLAFDPATGRITGIPDGLAAAATHTVAAENAGGRAVVALAVSVRSNRAESLATQRGTLTDDDRRHFLSRTSFGVTPAAMKSLSKKGLASYVNGMLAFGKAKTKAEKQAFKELVNDEDPNGFEGMFPSESDLARWWLSIMVNSDRPFQEVLAMFWHDHFATSSEVLSSDRRHWMVDHVNLWRKDGAGNLRDLLVDMTRDRAMLRWLDGISNRRQAPNENFGREFWELFTLGVDNGYTQADILEAARAFTGYRERYDEETKLRTIEFDPERHDTGDKTFFGRTIPGQDARDDFEAVVDITLEERPVAEFICEKLFAYFCYEEPPEEIVAGLAAELRANRWELRPVLKMLLTSEAFFSGASKRGRVKSPVDFSVGFIRSTGLVIRTSSLDASLREQGQRPTQPPTVDGWPEGAFWLSAQAMVERANLTLTCITDRTRQEEAGVDITKILPKEKERTAENVVDTLAALLRVPLGPEDREELVAYLNTQRNSDGTISAAPFDGTDPRHLDERVRGLLYILAQNPASQVR